MGGDWAKVHTGCLLSGYINDTHTYVPGPDGKFGYGGKCFPKDVNEPDAGQSDALNKGFAKAKGEWLFWLNADDILLPEARERVVDRIHKLALSPAHMRHEERSPRRWQVCYNMRHTEGQTMDKKLYINPPLVNRAYDWKKGPQPKTRAALDKFFNSPAINRVKDQICEMGRRIYARGYTDGNGGNLSVRVGEDLVLCSPTLCCKGFMTREDICLVDMNAGQLCGYRPRTSEVKVHIAMMKTAGWSACVHCHPPHCNAFVFAGQVPPSGINPEADIFFNQIPLAPYGTPGTDEVAANVAQMSKKSNVVFMENHGIVCGARDIEEAEWFAENADAYCQVLLLAAGHGAKLQQVGPKSVKDFLAIRQAMGLPVDPKQALYNTHRFNGYKMGVASK